MAAIKIAVTIEESLLAQLDRLVASKRFPNRSRAVQEAVRDKLERLEHSRLARECAKLNVAEETALAEEGLEVEIEQWPDY